MTANDVLPLKRGDVGGAVEDLNARLTSIGYATPGDRFDARTELAVKGFQGSRGLDITGICDARCWSSLVEANFALGDRNLYLHTPLWRGDDVAELQLALGELGFDAGRIDGIFGPDTLEALLDFQRNAGLVVDGIAGRRTVRDINRYRGRIASSQPVTTVKERSQLLAASQSTGELRVVVGEQGGVAALVGTVARELRRGGATVLTLDHPSATARAKIANTFAADIYLGFMVTPEPTWTSWFFSVPGYESIGGHQLATRLATCGSTIHSVTTAHAAGGPLPILRETKMPAVVCELGPTDLVVRSAAAIAAGVAREVVAWATNRTGSDGPKQRSHQLVLAPSPQP